MTTHIPNGTLVTLPDGSTATAYLGRDGTYSTCQPSGHGDHGKRVDLGWRREQLTVVETVVVAAVGSDGIRPVVWGLGSTAAMALEDADEQDHGGTWNEGGTATVEIPQRIADRIQAGEVDCADLGIAVTMRNGEITGASVVETGGAA